MNPSAAALSDGLGIAGTASSGPGLETNPLSQAGSISYFQGSEAAHEAWVGLQKSYGARLRLVEQSQRLMAQPARAEQRRQLESTTALIRQIDDLRRDLLTLLNSLQESDTAPTAPA